MTDILQLLKEKLSTDIANIVYNYIPNIRTIDIDGNEKFYSLNDNITNFTKIVEIYVFHIFHIVTETVFDHNLRSILGTGKVILSGDMTSKFERSHIRGYFINNDSFNNHMSEDPIFNADISNWDVRNVTNMKRMFMFSSFNGDISRWKVDNVTNMQQMFTDSSFNGDISSWTVSNVTHMRGMFGWSVFNGDISSWDISKVTDMSFMFINSRFRGDISSWNLLNVDINNMFSDSLLE